MYYKLPFIAGMIVVILAMYFLITTLTTKDTALSVMLIDCHTEMSGEEMAEEYMDTAGIDKKKVSGTDTEQPDVSGYRFRQLFYDKPF